MKKSEALGILGLSDGASDDEVKAAHRKLVIEHHPDKFAQDSAEYARAEEKTKLINEARDVLLSRKWEPEFGRGYANPYAGPYASPFVRPGGGSSSGQPGQGGDPFEGWPFGQGQTGYVWTSWDDARDAQGGVWDPFGFTREPEITPEERLAHAKQSLRRESTYIGAKLFCLVICALLGVPAAGFFVYLAASIVYGLWKRLGGCLYILFVPLVVIAVPFMLLLAPWAGVVTGGLAVFFALAVLFDLVNMRKLVAEYRAAKEAVKK